MTAPPPPPPEFIGPYRLYTKIFETEHAIVYESYHEQKCCKLAIKCIKKAKANPQAIEDEVNIMRSLQHQNIIQAMDVFDIEFYYCVVMPLATGGDLFEIVYQNGKMKEQTVCKIMYSMLQAIDYCHSIGIMHRDIKPENIFLQNGDLENPLALLADFGFAKRFNPGQLLNDSVGTPIYAAPEIYLHKPCMYYFIFA